MTEITEGIWNRATSFFDLAEFGIIAIYRVCPVCSRFITKGQISIYLTGDVKLRGWICKTHGEVKPDYKFTEAEQR